MERNIFPVKVLNVTRHFSALCLGKGSGYVRLKLKVQNNDRTILANHK